MRTLLLASVLSIGLIGSVSAQSMPEADPSHAVFLLLVTDREVGANGLVHTYGFGTGFFVSADGTALTASHVVYSAAHDMQKYRLEAIVGREFYDVTVICASKLPYDPSVRDTNRAGIPFTRDVAEVKLISSTAFDGRKDTLYTVTKSGERLLWATAHKDALPEFPALAISSAPLAQYAHVRVVGFGDISAIPRAWTSDGQIDRTYTGQDGTPLFDMVSSNPTQPGDSGAPVLNEQNQVVGLWVWHYNLKPGTATAEGSAVLQKPCQ